MLRNSLFHARAPQDSDFKQLITSGRTFIDNSEFIRTSLNDGSYVKVMKFPPATGKSTLLSMLRYFFATTVDGVATKNLFNNLAIHDHPAQGTKSVIFLDFSQMDINDFADMDAFLDYFGKITNKLYEQYRHVIPNYAQNLTKSKDKSARSLDLGSSIYYLAGFITSYNEKQGMSYSERKPIILIDAPCIPKNLTNKTQQKIADFFRYFYSRTCKDTDDKISNIWIMRHVDDDAMLSNNCSHYSFKYESPYAKYFRVIQEHVEQSKSFMKLTC